MGKGDVGGWVVISDMTDDICDPRSYATLQVMDIGKYRKSFRMKSFMVYLVHAWRAAGFFIMVPYILYGKRGVRWVLISEVTDDIRELRSYATLQVMDIGRYH